jgi:hypothetical protein
MSAVVKEFFHNPCVLGFDPAGPEMYEKDEFGISLTDVWEDELARFLWCSIKSRHLTSQYFRRTCLANAAALRADPPSSETDFKYLLRGDSFTGLSGHAYDAGYYAQAYPYVLALLHGADAPRLIYIYHHPQPSIPDAGPRESESQDGDTTDSQTAKVCDYCGGTGEVPESSTRYMACPKCCGARGETR